MKRTAVVTDEPTLIAAEIGRMKKAGCQVIMTTGGLCLRCPVCRYPVCPFGKGA